MLDFTCEYTSVLGPFALCQQLPGCPKHPPGRTPSARSPPGPDQGIPGRLGTPLVGTPDCSVACLRVIVLAAK